MHEKNIKIIKNGSPEKANIRKMFSSYGPYLIDDLRLDTLTSVNLLVDSSTTISHQTGNHESITKAKTGSMLGRAVVGGVLLGGTGAVVGAVTGKKTTDTDINTTTRETKNTVLTAELVFDNGYTMNVLLTSIESYHWLISLASQEPMSDTDIESEKKISTKHAQEQKQIEIKDRAKLATEHLRPDIERSAPMILIAGAVIAALLFNAFGNFALSFLCFFIPFFLFVLSYKYREGMYQEALASKYEELRNDPLLIEEIEAE